MGSRHLDAITLGEFPPAYALNLSGSRPVTAATRQLLWQGPTLLRTLRTTAGALTCESTLAADAGLILIGFFLDAAWKLRVFTCTFPPGYAGGVPVDCIDRASGSIITRAIRMWGLQVVAPFTPVVGGNGQSFAGTVECFIGPDLQDILVPAQTLLNQSDTAAVTVPAGFTLLLRGMDASVLSLTANFAAYVETRANSITSSAQGSVFRSPPGFAMGANGAVGRVRWRDQPIAVPAGFDVRIVGFNVSGGGPENIMGDVACTLVRDTLSQKPETTGPPDALPRPGVLV